MLDMHPPQWWPWFPLSAVTHSPGGRGLPLPRFSFSPCRHLHPFAVQNLTLLAWCVCPGVMRKVAVGGSNNHFAVEVLELFSPVVEGKNLCWAHKLPHEKKKKKKKKKGGGRKIGTRNVNAAPQTHSHTLTLTLTLTHTHTLTLSHIHSPSSPKGKRPAQHTAWSKRFSKKEKKERR